MKALAVSGTGDIALEADEASVSVVGSRDADVTASETLTVSIAGVGNVNFSGDATVTSSIAGPGSVVNVETIRS